MHPVGWLKVQKVSVYLSMSPPCKYLIFTCIGINGVLSVFSTCPLSHTKYDLWHLPISVVSLRLLWLVSSYQRNVHACAVGKPYARPALVVIVLYARLVQRPLNCHFKATFYLLQTRCLLSPRQAHGPHACFAQTPESRVQRSANTEGAPPLV